MAGSKPHAIRKGITFALGAVPIALAAVYMAVGNASVGSLATGSGDWPKYQSDYASSGFNSAETTITDSTAASLKLLWSEKGAVGVSAQPIAIGNNLYWGDWGGNLHDTIIAGAGAGTDVWSKGLGENFGACAPKDAALGGAPGLGAVNGTPAVFVENIANGSPQGGTEMVYALNAATGAILWQTPVSTDGHTFSYSSTVVYGGSVYTTNTSLGDCPMVRGAILKLNENTGAVENTWFDTRTGCIGAGVTSSPSIDTATGMVYWATGAPGCGSIDGRGAGAGDYNTGVLELKASDLSFVNFWPLPQSDETKDGDFIDTPTLLDAPVAGTSGHLLAVANKSGMEYFLDRSSLTLSFKVHLATSNGGPQSGQASISPAVWDGTNLYVASGHDTLQSPALNAPTGTLCAGTLRSINPLHSATNPVNWTYCAQQGHILGASAGAPGIIVVGAGNHILVFDSHNGSILFDYNNGGGTSTYPGTNIYWAGAAISNGRIFEGSMGGTMYALGTGTAPPPTTPPATPTPCTGPSNAATNLVATSPAAGEFDMTWTAPTTCGPTPYYAVALYSASTNTFAESEVSGTSFQATGLIPNTYYIATVTAYNGAAWSAWSTYSNWVLIAGVTPVQHVVQVTLCTTNATGFCFGTPTNGAVHTGDTIVWQDTTGVNHGVTWDATAATADSPFISADSSTTPSPVTAAAGTYHYHCTIHGTAQAGAITVA